MLELELELDLELKPGIEYPYCLHTDPSPSDLAQGAAADSSLQSTTVLQCTRGGEGGSLSLCLSFKGRATEELSDKICKGGVY